MELTHLVHALARWQRRPLLVFALAGGLLFAGRQGAERLLPAAHQPVPLTVSVEPGATPQQIERATDDAVLLSFALRSGFVYADPAVRDRLVRNVRFADGALSESEALQRAVALDMHRTDAVARARLLWLARERVSAANRIPASEAELRAYLQAHPERFRRPPRLSFEQVFVSRQRHGDGFAQRVREVARDPQQALSDPGLLPARMRHASALRIDARFGKGFADKLAALDGAGWSAPITSSFGAHFVRVTERMPGALPQLSEVRDRVRHEHERDSHHERLRAALSRMRAAYRIRIRERG